MLRRLIDSVLVRLHILKASEHKAAIVTLTELLPMIFACAIIMGAVRWLGPVEIPWYRRLWRKVKYSFRRYRALLIGY